MTDIDEARPISFPRARGMDKQSETDRVLESSNVDTKNDRSLYAARLLGERECIIISEDYHNKYH